MHPILIDIPFPITTNRLSIRPPEPGDGKHINEAVLESFTTLNEWMPWAAKRPTLEESEINAREAHIEWLLRKEIRLQLWERSSGKLIGCSGLHAIDWDIRRFSTGYWVRQSHVGQGFISEAVAAVALFVFKELKGVRLELTCDVENVRSRKVAERTGFVLEGIRKQDSRKPNTQGLRDTMVFARLNADGLGDVGAKWQGY